jgi:hypothetical protein
MIKVKSKTIRGGIVIVGQAKINVGPDGVAEVTDEQAEKLLQGATWSRVSSENQPPPLKKTDPLSHVFHAAEESVEAVTDLITHADDHANEKPENVLNGKPSTMSRFEELMAWSKDELVDMAFSFGLTIDRRLSKPKIVKAIIAANQ